MSGNRREQQMETVDTFLRVHHVPPAISDRVRNYYDYLWQREVHNDEMSIMEGLSTSLKSELVLFIYRDMVESVPFFHNKHPQFITSVVLNLKLEIFAPGDGIASAGENGNHMYFIMNGTVTVRRQKEGETNIVTPGMIPQVQSYRERVISAGFDPYEEGPQDKGREQHGGETVDTLTAGQYFGEVAVLTGQRRTASIVAETYCELYSLSKADIERVLQDWPEIAESFSLLGEAEELRDAKLTVKDDLEDSPEAPWMHGAAEGQATNKSADSELPSTRQQGGSRPKHRPSVHSLRNKPGFTLVRDLLQVKALAQTPPLSNKHRQSLREELRASFGKDPAQDGDEGGTSASKGQGPEFRPPSWNSINPAQQLHWDSPSMEHEMEQNTPGQPLQTFPSCKPNQLTPGATQSPKSSFGATRDELIDNNLSGQ
ncbi:hypothetical protein CYMTET_22114 [Cymbomonas tetramitiformis]|uniref:Cyclic nucleotide-binding domain-containing protein n=1 Tax=Cymbomonas tetramitiformis TaxID=36881 RepID=A0AAE0G1H5_9CHLO|nr:hypothetical protein CYMTET_22114 [Cymbomonas tetramitiformis]